MKKLALAAAISATVSVSAEATIYSISSSITGSQMYVSRADDQVSNTMTFGGTINIDTDGYWGSEWAIAVDQAGAATTLTGSQGISTGNTVFTYGLTGASSSGGILFNSGIVDVEAGGTPYATIDASVDNIHFDSAGTYLSHPIGGIDMSGGWVNGDGTITIALSGLWPGSQPLGYYDNSAAAAQATGGATLFGNSALIFLEGELTLTQVSEVPVPAAAWLFGSALIGLVGLKRKKQRESI